MGLLIVNELSVQMIRSAAAALSILVLASCSHNVPEGTTTRTPESSEYQPPAQVRNATYAWSAENGIDLLDERGQLVRAAHESMIIAHYGGMDATYPGFAEVLDPEFASQINTRWDRSLAGTMQSHILQITETDIGFKATVCSQPSHFAIREADGTYRITNGPDERNTSSSTTSSTPATTQDSTPRTSGRPYTTPDHFRSHQASPHPNTNGPPQPKTSSPVPAGPSPSAPTSARPCTAAKTGDAASNPTSLPKAPKPSSPPPHPRPCRPTPLVSRRRTS